jgi:hypothetical protein
VTFAAETTRERTRTTLERRDIDRHDSAVIVAGRYARGEFTPYPKAHGQRHPRQQLRHRRPQLQRQSCDAPRPGDPWTTLPTYGGQWSRSS